MKILLASEEITNSPREGSLVFLMHLSRFLHREGELTVVHAVGEFDPDIRALRVLSPKTLVTRELLRIARRERFDVVLSPVSSVRERFGFDTGFIMPSFEPPSLQASESGDPRAAREQVRSPA
jgi:hypothetical protein